MKNERRRRRAELKRERKAKRRHARNEKRIKELEKQVAEQEVQSAIVGEVKKMFVDRLRIYADAGRDYQIADVYDNFINSISSDIADDFSSGKFSNEELIARLDDAAKQLAEEDKQKVHLSAQMLVTVVQFRTR